MLQEEALQECALPGPEGSDSELGNQLAKLFGTIDTTQQLVEQLGTKLHAVLRPAAPTPESPNKPAAQLHPLLSPLTDALEIKGNVLKKTNNSLLELIQRLAL